MTSAELKYMIAIEEIYDEKNGVKLIDIATRAGVSKVSVYRAMERMEKNGYIERNEKNKVVLTEFGKNELASHKDIVSFLKNNIEKYCRVSEDIAYNDAMCVACALSGISRERLNDLKRE